MYSPSFSHPKSRRNIKSAAQNLKMSLTELKSNEDDVNEVDFIGSSGKSLNSILQDQQSLSLSTIGGASKAANSVLTSDETVVRRGDGALVAPVTGKEGCCDYDASMVDVLTKMAMGKHSPNRVELDEKSDSRNSILCCCCKGRGSI